jgi:hypothetical protein
MLRGMYFVHYILYLTYIQVLLLYLQNIDTALEKGDRSLVLAAVLRDHFGGGAVPRSLPVPLNPAAGAPVPSVDLELCGSCCM